MTEPSNQSNVNPFAPTTETVASSSTKTSKRHPAKWPLLIVAVLILVPVVLGILVAADSFPIDFAQVFFLMLLASLAIVPMALAFLPYTSITRSVSVLVFGLLSGFVGVMMLLGALSLVTLIILLLFLWIFIASMSNQPPRKNEFA